MDPIKASAQFAAFTWFTSKKQSHPQLQQEAWQYTEENWLAFLPESNPGLGQLLLKIADRPTSQNRRRFARPSKGGKLAVAG